MPRGRLATVVVARKFIERDVRARRGTGAAGAEREGRVLGDSSAMDGRGRGRTTATFAARVRDAGKGADVVDVVDALERAGGAETEARAAMEDGDFAEAAARYDEALKTLASSDAVESALELRAVRLRFSCFVGLAMACASLVEHERGLANSHAAFG